MRREDLKCLLGILVFLLIIVTAMNVSTLLNGDGYWNGKGDVTIGVTGDVMVGRNTPAALSGQGSAFGGIGDTLASCDILLINFENAATTSEIAAKSDVPLKTDPSNIQAILLDTEIVASIANNHAFDYGTSGASDTRSNLKSNGISVIGAGDNAEQAHTPYVKEINGRKITILNYMDSDNFVYYSQSEMPIAGENSPGYSAYNREVMESQIHEARENGSDFVLVYFHYGNEYVSSPNAVQEDMSHAAIDAGADAVVGSHPHVPQGIELYHNKTIFYSLGDTVFDLQRPETLVAYVVTFNLTGSQCIATVYPIQLIGYLPYFMDSESGASLLSSLSPSCSALKINNDGTGTIAFNLTNPNA